MAGKLRDRPKKQSPPSTLWEPSLSRGRGGAAQAGKACPQPFFPPNIHTLCTPSVCTSQGLQSSQKSKKRPFSGRKACGPSEPNAGGRHRTLPLWARGPENAPIVPCPTPDPLCPPPAHTCTHSSGAGSTPRDAPTPPPVVASPAAEPPAHLSGPQVPPPAAQSPQPQSADPGPPLARARLRSQLPAWPPPHPPRQVFPQLLGRQPALLLLQPPRQNWGGGAGTGVQNTCPAGRQVA